jgi:hypothetical protein
MQFRFRLRWRMERGRSFTGLDEPMLMSISPGIIDCQLKSVGAESAAGGQDLVLRSGVFLTRPEAEKAGRETLAALMLLSVRKGYGISLVPRTPPPLITDYGIEYFSQILGVYSPVLRDSYGLTIYRELGGTRFISGGDMMPKVSGPAEAVATQWKECLAANPVVDERVILCHDLYASSRSENSSRARFLMLVMAIESLLERVPRGDTEQNAIDTMIACLSQLRLTNNDIQSLKASLEPLKFRSIGSLGRQFLKRARLAGVVSNENVVSLFDECYGVRSKIVHEGLNPTPSVLSDYSNALDVLVRELLTALLEGRFRRT